MHLSQIALLAPVIVIVLVMKFVFSRTITWGESIAHFAVALALVWGTYYLGLSSKMRDHQLLNGVVTGKEQVWVSCEHSYECHCRTDKNGNRSCDTCYEHPNDWDWDVYTNAGVGPESQFTIERVDSRGSIEPRRWSRVHVGEPVALERTYSNYVLASPESIFHRIATNKRLPDYPKGYDYSHAARVIADGVKVPDLDAWNADMDAMLSRLGPARQANVVLVFSGSASPQYGEDLRNLWLGGKKNDTIVVLGTPHYPEIAWVNVFSWSKSEMLNVALRNDLTELHTVDRRTLLPTIERNVGQFFIRRPMAEYAYLKDNIEPTPTFMVMAWILAFVAPIGLGIFFDRFDIDGGFTTRRFNRRF